MSLAQQLYEGIDVGAAGHQGLITYMRTDSTRISDEAQDKVKKYIIETFGTSYAGAGRTSKAKATTQDAHEAIRPTEITLTPQAVRSYLTPDQYKLYTLIWQRFVTSFMTPAIFATTRVDITAGSYIFRARGSHIEFDGFYAVWSRNEEETILPKLKTQEKLLAENITPSQHFTQPPPRFNEASLIKELEEQGIGRPSTYVPIISTIQDRGYADQEQRKFIPTWLGETVNEVMKKHFPNIVDIGFTATMEHQLDEVEAGKESWKAFLQNFYGDFKQTLAEAEAEMNRVQKPVEEIDEICPECGKKLAIRLGRFGKFISCTTFPTCTYRRSIVHKTGASCPQCGGDLIERQTRQKKKMFYGCSNYPTCNFALWEKPIEEKCSQCGGLMVIPKVGAAPVCYTEIILPQKTKDQLKYTRKRKTGTKGKKTKTKRITPKGKNISISSSKGKQPLAASV
jgi:DNA topoisomerase-1